MRVNVVVARVAVGLQERKGIRIGSDQDQDREIAIKVSVSVMIRISY